MCTTNKQLFCTLHYQLYHRGQDNNAAESLASICNNIGSNEPRNVSAVGKVGGNHVVNSIGDTEIITTAMVLGLT